MRTRWMRGASAACRFEAQRAQRHGAFPPPLLSEGGRGQRERAAAAPPLAPVVSGFAAGEGGGRGRRSFSANEISPAERRGGDGAVVLRPLLSPGRCSVKFQSSSAALRWLPNAVVSSWRFSFGVLNLFQKVFFYSLLVEMQLKFSSWMNPAVISHHIRATFCPDCYKIGHISKVTRPLPSSLKIRR